MKQQLVTVELIKDPRVKRQMTLASAKFNAGKWRIVEKTLAKEEPTPVKKDVEPVVESDFAQLDASQDDIADLRAEFEQLTGKKPHGRVKAETLKAEIEKLKSENNEA